MTNQMCQNLSWFRNQNVSNHLTTDRVHILKAVFRQVQQGYIPKYRQDVAEFVPVHRPETGQHVPGRYLHALPSEPGSALVKS